MTNQNLTKEKTKEIRVLNIGTLVPGEQAEFGTVVQLRKPNGDKYGPTVFVDTPMIITHYALVRNIGVDGDDLTAVAVGDAAMMRKLIALDKNFVERSVREKGPMPDFVRKLLPEGTVVPEIPLSTKTVTPYESREEDDDRGSETNPKPA